MQILGDRIIFGPEDWVGGISPDLVSANTDISILGRGYARGVAFDPLTKRLGVAYPGKGTTNLTNVDGSNPEHTITDVASVNGKQLIYGAAGATIQQMGVNNDVLTVTGDFPHTITAAAPSHSGHLLINRDPAGSGSFKANYWNSVVEYNVTTETVTTKALLYSWYDTTDWDVGFYDPAGDIQFLEYDGETGAFTVGLIITGGTSGATGVIEVLDDNGATGGFMLSGVTGTFQDNEAITDTSTGVAVVNGTIKNLEDAWLTRYTTSAPTGATLTDGADRPHPMNVSRQDGLLYIGSANKIHSYKGSTNTFTTADLTLLADFANFVVKSIKETPFDMVVFADRSVNGNDPDSRSQAFAFFWDESRPTDPYKNEDLRDDFVGAAFEVGNTVGCFTGFRNGAGTIRVLEGGEFVEKAHYTGSNFDHLPTQGGVDVQNNIIYFKADNDIYGFGNWRNTLDGPGLHNIAQYGDTPGFLKIVKGSTFYTSGGSGTNGAAKLTGFSGSGSVETLTAFPPFPKGHRGKIDQVDVQFIDSVSGGQQYTLKLNIDESSTTILSAVTDTSTRKRKITKDTSNDPLPFFEGVSLLKSWANGSDTTISPGVQSITVWYTPTKITEE